MNEMRRIECEETGKAQYFELDRHKCRRSDRRTAFLNIAGVMLLFVLLILMCWLGPAFEGF